MADDERKPISMQELADKLRRLEERVAELERRVEALELGRPRLDA